jgi:hypothetical protein
VPVLSKDPSWIVADWAIADFEKAGMSVPLVEAYFDNPRTYLILHPGNSKIDQQLPKATWTDRFTSFVSMQQAFSAGSLPSGVKAVMYDNEAWTLTPANEKSAPVSYARQAQALAHTKGLQFIFTPATNLAGVLQPTQAAAKGSGKYTSFLSLNLPSQSAGVSDVYDIQSQQAEGTGEFQTFVQQAAAQARRANSHVVVMAGIGPNPDGRYVPASTILSSYQSVASTVDGFWLNLPAGNGQCIGCGQAEPSVAVQFLQMLEPSLEG